MVSHCRLDKVLIDIITNPLFERDAPSSKEMLAGQTYPKL
jgi:hypothetical protein